jgi:hypothetical protein
MKNFEVLGEMLNDERAAKILGVQPSTMKSLRCRGIGPTFVKLGRGLRAAVRYDQSDLHGIHCRRSLGTPARWRGEPINGTVQASWKSLLDGNFMAKPKRIHRSTNRPQNRGQWNWKLSS